MEKFRTIAGSLSPLSVIALLSVLALIAVSVSRTTHYLEADAQSMTYVAKRAAPALKVDDAMTQQELLLLGLTSAVNPNATSTEDSISLIGPQVAAQLVGQYAGLVGSGTYNEQTGAAAAEAIAANVKAAVTYKTYSAADLKTDSNTSFDRMLQYKSDLRDAFRPLLENTSDEFELYAEYVESKNTVYLDQLTAAAKKYREAADLTAHVAVPQDAIRYHVAILDAMQSFAATLDAMVAHVDDPITSVALLRSYNDAEQQMYYSFNDLGTYYRSKTP